MKKIYYVVLFLLMAKTLSAQTINYTYDNLNRLTQVTYPDNSIITYTYDASGNRSSVKTKNANYHAPQTITFNAIAVKPLGTVDFSPGATSSSGLPVIYTSSNTDVASIINGKVHILSIGTVTITASQPGNATYAAAADVSQTLTISGSGNALLTSLKVTPATALTKVPGPGISNYITSVPNSETSLRVTATHQDANSTIKVNGQLVASGVASQPIPLNIGDNIINIVVTAQDDAITNTYTITATRAASPVATLAGLALSTGTLSPAFTSGTASYTVLVPNAASSIKITPLASETGATIKINGNAVASGSQSAAIPLTTGANTITTVVTAPDGVGTKTYTLTITHAAANLSTNALLTSLKVNPATTLTRVNGPGFSNYTTSVPNSETSVKVTAIHQDANSAITINGLPAVSGVPSQPIPLNVGDNVINVVVTAQDGATTNLYIITATRAASPVATLASLTLSTGTLSPAFAPGTTTYTALVPNATPAVTITPTASETGATIKVNGSTVASGSQSAAIPLTGGVNVITTIVTAPDGVGTKTYTVTINLSTNALLTSLKVSPATTLTRVNGPGFSNYTTPVPNSETSLKVIATHQDANSTITVSGQPVTSGIASQPIPLNVGDNVINVVVTAQDGATTKTYIITANRAAPAGLAAEYDEPVAKSILSNGVTVHQGLSPNGDGDNDILTIDGITNYPDNALQIMSRSGELVYQVKGYDNSARAFDGQSNINGKLQPAGTYFYSLNYKDGNDIKHKTGFIVLKY